MFEIVWRTSVIIDKMSIVKILLHHKVPRSSGKENIYTSLMWNITFYNLFIQWNNDFSSNLCMHWRSWILDQIIFFRCSCRQAQVEVGFVIICSIYLWWRSLLITLYRSNHLINQWWDGFFLMVELIILVFL